MQKKLLKSISILVLGMLIIGSVGCDMKTDCCTIIDTAVQILYKNEIGDNLINSNSDFDESKIKVYYKIGSEFEYVYNGNLDSPNMHRIDEDENGNLILTVYPSNSYEGNQSTTLVELNQNVVDTLVCEFELGINKEICKKSWLNGVEMDNRFIEIEK
ncbi:MAG: hypothetical protein IPN29_02530 [Saprospiraceae bacterium]|nr:hypothetical protein [Saprospiraceae bacterium]